MLYYIQMRNTLILNVPHRVASQAGGPFGSGHTAPLEPQGRNQCYRFSEKHRKRWGPVQFLRFAWFIWFCCVVSTLSCSWQVLVIDTLAKLSHDADQEKAFLDATAFMQLHADVISFEAIHAITCCLKGLSLEDVAMGAIISMGLIGKFSFTTEFCSLYLFENSVFQRICDTWSCHFLSSCSDCSSEAPQVLAPTMPGWLACWGLLHYEKEQDMKGHERQ